MRSRKSPLSIPASSIVAEDLPKSCSGKRGSGQIRAKSAGEGNSLTDLGQSSPASTKLWQSSTYVDRHWPNLGWLWPSLAKIRQTTAKMVRIIVNDYALSQVWEWVDIARCRSTAFCAPRALHPERVSPTASQEAERRTNCMSSVRPQANSLQQLASSLVRLKAHIFTLFIFKLGASH